MNDLIDRLRSEAEISDRPGQYDRLNELADEFAAEIEALREEVERLRADQGSRGQQTAHPAITFCDNCGCDWLDNGLNPIGCPYCEQFAQVAEIKALRSERDALREALKDMRQVLEALGRAHQTAMEQTLKARIPECAEFAGIAQDLDFVVTTLREWFGDKT